MKTLLWAITISGVTAIPLTSSIHDLCTMNTVKAAGTTMLTSILDTSWEYLFRNMEAHFSNDALEFIWSLKSTENVDGIEILAEDRDGIEKTLDTLSPTAAEYSITENIYTYRKIKITYYRSDGIQKIYGSPWEIENILFSEYLLKDGITGIQYHTQDEIRNMWKKYSPKDIKDKYTSKPKNKIPYKKGSVADSTLKNGVNTLNFIRYVAGISSDVTIRDSYQSLAQAAALVNFNDKSDWISHFPSKPKGMNDELYEEGYEGSSSSNLGAGHHNLYASILGWMSDSDSSNIDRVGHRRWCLNPSMKYTGFGIDNNIYSMYVFDKSGSDNGIHGVSWPAQNTPLNLFHNEDAWSISMGIPVPENDCKVVLTRKRDNRKWSFTMKNSNKNGNYMNINNDNRGQIGCIIFRPKKIKYKNGDSFQVDISGKDFSFSYNVNFFSLK